MLGGWFKRKMQLTAIKGGREDLERFIESLRGQSDKEIGEVVALAAIMRVDLREANHLPDEMLGITSDPEQSLVQLRMANLVRTYQRDKQLLKACGTMVWVHTLRALSTPELRLLGRQMWGQLQRGMPHAAGALRRLGLPPLNDYTVACAFIPEDLDPDTGESPPRR